MLSRKTKNALENIGLIFTIGLMYTFFGGIVVYELWNHVIRWGFPALPHITTTFACLFATACWIIGAIIDWEPSK